MYFKIGEEAISKWEYFENTMTGTPEIAAVIIDRQEMDEAVNNVEKFNTNIATGSWGVSPVELGISDNYKNEITWPTATRIKQELQVGDLEWQLIYDIEQKKYRLDRSEFSLAWSDYLWFFSCWEKFVKDVSKT